MKTEGESRTTLKGMSPGKPGIPSNKMEQDIVIQAGNILTKEKKAITDYRGER